MNDAPPFDFNQPTRETLAGIYVEATDGNPAEVLRGRAPGQPVAADQPPPSLEELFGITLTVTDSDKGSG